MPKLIGANAAALANEYKSFSLKDTLKAAGELGQTLTSGGVMRRMMALCHHAGVEARAKHKMSAYDADDVFTPFEKGWYIKGESGQRKPLKASSRKTTVEALQSFVDLGLRPWNSMPLLTVVMDSVNVPMSSRAAMIDKFLTDDYLTKGPTDAEIKAKFKPKKRDGSAKYNGKGALRGLCSGAETLTGKDKAPFIDWLKDNPKFGALVREYLEAAAAIRQALADETSTSEKNRKDWRKLVALTTTTANKLGQRSARTKQ